MTDKQWTRRDEGDALLAAVNEARVRSGQQPLTGPADSTTDVAELDALASRVMEKIIARTQNPEAE